MQMKMALAVAIAACLALLIPVSYAAVSHTVGDSTGWTTPPSPSFYSSWASKQSSFNVGDFLVFNYAGSTETVAEVTKSAYDSCSALNPITQVNNGPVNVTITSPGPHYYISTDPGHCSAGQKFFITAASPNIPPPTPPAAPAPKSATPTTPSGAKSPAASTPTATPGSMSPATTPTATPTGKGGAMTPSTTPSPPSMTPATTPTAAPGSMSPASSPMVAPESSPMSPTGAPSSTISSSPATAPTTAGSAPGPSMGADAPMAGGPMSGGPTASSTPAAADGGMKTPAEAPAETGSASATRIAGLILLPVLLVITPNFLF